VGQWASELTTVVVAKARRLCPNDTHDTMKNRPAAMSIITQQAIPTVSAGAASSTSVTDESKLATQTRQHTRVVHTGVHTDEHRHRKAITGTIVKIVPTFSAHKKISSSIPEPLTPGNDPAEQATNPQINKARSISRIRITFTLSSFVSFRSSTKNQF
jgi:hypothetical protein